MVLSSLFLCFRGKKSRTERNYSEATNNFSSANLVGVGSFGSVYKVALYPSNRLVVKVSYSTLSEATDNFSSANLVGVGSFGSVYKVALYPGDRLVAVKVFNSSRWGASNSFTAECDMSRNIRHRNIVKIVTTCSSRGNDFKALVYEFMENGSLEEWLRSTSTQNPPRNLNLLQRLNIAIDVASALDYLHNHCETPIVHCDIKPSNILLDNKFTGRVSDFGLARFLSKTNKTVATQSSSLRSVGYVAPEYKKGSEASTDGDIYSFGILLLEMFTGKRPGDQMFKDNLNLHTYVKRALFQRVKEIADPRLFEYNQNPPTENCARYSSQIQGACLSCIFEIGIACSSKSAKERTKMGNVVSRLQHIRDVLKALHGEIISSYRAWILPPQGSLSVYSDATWDSTTRKAGIAVIIRNHEGKVLNSYAGTAHALCPLAAELIAIIEGLELIPSVPSLPIIFTLDSQSLVNALKSGKAPEDWRVTNLFLKARLLSSNRQISWHRSSRIYIANKVAYLAATGLCDLFPPPSLVKTLVYDGLPCPHQVC